jgi:hypothetical protein
MVNAAQYAGPLRAPPRSPRANSRFVSARADAGLIPRFTLAKNLWTNSAVLPSNIGHNVNTAWTGGEGILGLPFALYVAGNRSTA